MAWRYVTQTLAAITTLIRAQVTTSAVLWPVATNMHFHVVLAPLGHLAPAVTTSGAPPPKQSFHRTHTHTYTRRSSLSFTNMGPTEMLMHSTHMYSGTRTCALRTSMLTDTDM